MLKDPYEGEGEATAQITESRGLESTVFACLIFTICPGMKSVGSVCVSRLLISARKSLWVSVFLRKGSVRSGAINSVDPIT